ncbi:DUF4091 domain-containing protein [candidate division KSB1 bacterium]|nr:DUF4091 domain-containing protein [candidate division KSB1 bacterium]
MKYFSLLIVLLMSLVTSEMRANDRLTLTIVDDCTKLKRDEKPPLQPFIWDPATKKITLFGARNEVIAFQLILSASKEAVRRVMVSASGLQGQSALIPSGNIHFFRHWYLHVTEPSSVMYGNPSSMGTGWYPDPLPPFNARDDAGAPFNVQPGIHQSVWVDIYIPAYAKSGKYSGVLKIYGENFRTEKLSIELTVWDFALPDTTHMKTFFYFGPEQVRAAHNIPKESADETELIAKYMRMAHQHRINLVTDAGDGLEWAHFDNAWGPYLDGSAFIEGPGKGVGCHLWSINISIWGGEDLFQKTARSVMEHFINKGWFNVPFLYVIDEPDEDRYEEVRKIGAWLDNTTYPGNILPFMLTEHIVPDLTGYVDIWNSSRIKLVDAQKRRFAGDRIWTYNGGLPGSGSQCIDHDGLAMRTWSWIAWKTRREAWHYWDCCYFMDKYNNHGETDTWENPLTYDQRPKHDADWGNGDGTLFYPGQQWAFHRDFVAGPVSSFRMKALRRGLQDYEYLWLAKQKGCTAEVEKIVNAVIPNPALGDAIEGTVCYLRGEGASAVWHDARIRLAQLILK